MWYNFFSVDIFDFQPVTAAVANQKESFSSERKAERIVLFVPSIEWRKKHKKWLFNVDSLPLFPSNEWFFVTWYIFWWFFHICNSGYLSVSHSLALISRALAHPNGIFRIYIVSWMWHVWSFPNILNINFSIYGKPMQMEMQARTM